jgi:hypothetical protein
MEAKTRDKVTGIIDAIEGAAIIVVGYAAFSAGNTLGTLTAVIGSGGSGIPMVIQVGGIAIMLWGIKKIVGGALTMFVQ